MNRSFPAMLRALLLTLAAASAASGAVRTISISGLTFNPPMTTANPGDTITWVGLATFHSVVQTNASGVCTVQGGGFNSGAPPVAGGTFSWQVPATFTGTVFFKCGPHCGSGMRGSIIVVAPPPCAGDADGNRSVNFADITSVLSNFNGAGPAGDADRNGSVNFADITSVLVNFNLPCP